MFPEPQDFALPAEAPGVCPDPLMCAPGFPGRVAVFQATAGVCSRRLLRCEADGAGGAAAAPADVPGAARAVQAGVLGACRGAAHAACALSGKAAGGQG